MPLFTDETKANEVKQAHSDTRAVRFTIDGQIFHPGESINPANASEAKTGAAPEASDTPEDKNYNPG